MKKGDRVRKAILQKAREEFYQNGYLETKMNQITESLELQPSWITYYFKGKENLALEIYRELFQRINARIRETEVMIQDSLQFHFVRIRLLYRIVFSDEREKRFFYELNKKKINILATAQLVDEMYREIIREYKLTVTEQEFRMIRGIDSAGRMDFFVRYLEGEYEISLDDGVSVLEGVVPRLLGIRQETVDSLLLGSIRIANAVDTGDLHLLR